MSDDIKANRTKLIVLEHYGKTCSCCGETCIPFLSLDHINGDGRQHRQQLPGCGTGPKLYRWLIKNGFPPGFRVLCINCNWGAKWNNGLCPHQDKTYTQRRYGVKE